MSDDLKRQAIAHIDAKADTLLSVSHDIHAHPELAFKEHHACGLLCDTLDAEGLPAAAGGPVATVTKEVVRNHPAKFRGAIEGSERTAARFHDSQRDLFDFVVDGNRDYGV